MSDKIKIYNPNDESQYIEMPVTKKLTLGKTSEYKETEMISGRFIKDFVGMRTSLEATWDMVPAATITAISTYISTGKYIKVTYPGIGTDETKYFDIKYPTMSVFKFVSGIAMWHGIVLKMIAQEVD